MPKFEVVSEYKPSGDQPQAIEALAEGIENGLDEQVLLGVTGSGKTFTMAKIIERVQAALNMVGVALVDHIIVADDDFVSMADSGTLKRW